MSNDSELLRQLVDALPGLMARVRHLEARECLGTALCGYPVDCSKAPTDRDMWVYDAGSTSWLHLLDIHPNNVEIDDNLVIAQVGAGCVIDAAGAITINGSHIKVDTFGAAATDDLDTINGATVTGTILIIRSVASARDPTLRDAVGNLVLAGAANFTLTNARDTIVLMYTGMGWLELMRSDNR